MFSDAGTRTGESYGFFFSVPNATPFFLPTVPVPPGLPSLARHTQVSTAHYTHTSHDKKHDALALLQLLLRALLGGRLFHALPRRTQCAAH